MTARADDTDRLIAKVIAYAAGRLPGTVDGQPVTYMVAIEHQAEGRLGDHGYRAHLIQCVWHPTGLPSYRAAQIGAYRRDPWGAVHSLDACVRGIKAEDVWPAPTEVAVQGLST